MVSALLYLQYHSFTNRIIMRVRRLKQPKYLVGAVVGGLYFYFYFFRYLAQARGGPASLGTGSTRDLALIESVGAVILLVLVVLAWIVPHKRVALVFTEAEVAFLFPAPISRRGLLHYKLIRSQTAIFFSTLLLALVFRRFRGPFGIHALGWWLILSTLNLHFLGSSFARTLLLEHGISNWKRRIAVLTVVFLSVSAVIVWARRTLPGLDLNRLDDFDSFKQYFNQLLTSGPAPYLLYPFRLVVRPYLAPNPAAFLRAVWPALLLMLLHYAWVIRSNVAFEEASVESSRKMAEKIASVRAGNWRGGSAKIRRRRAPFTLHPSGFPAVALLWKNVISAGQAFTLRLWIVLLVTATGASIGLSSTLGKSGWVPALGLIAAMLIPWSLLFGPQFLRQDFRQDLPSADMLKSYPLRGWEVALGELAGPATILTCLQWFLLLVAAGFSSQSHEMMPRPTIFGIALGAAIVLPMLNFLLFQIPNAAVLLFPAWFQASRDGAHGIEATGQRLISLLGQLLAFAVALIPAGGCSVVAFYLLHNLFGVSLGLAIPLASLIAAMVLGIEGVLGLMLLGRLFERFDLSSEQIP